MTYITEINIVPIKPQDGKVAHASCVIDDKLYLGSLAIYTRPHGGYRLSYPTKRNGSISFDIYHPINKQVGQLIENAILKEFLNINGVEDDLKNDQY
jgi:DNA-binding cell septation regulator SpoVG